MAYPQSLKVLADIQPGDRIEVVHQVKVGFRDWQTVTVGTVQKKARRRHSLHHQRNYDDKVYSDIVVLRRDDGELTTVTLDEFSDLRILESADQSQD